MSEWDGYVRETAKEYGVPVDIAWMLFVMLGESEAYDGFITSLEDMATERGATWKA